MTPTTHIVITGASGAIGSALARAYARPNTKLWLLGRRRDVLEELAQSCRLEGAQTETVVLDVGDVAAIESWGQNHAPTRIDLLIINAGVNIHADLETGQESVSASQALLQVNLLGAITLTQAVIPAMQRHGKGQIALISSLAAWRGLPQTPSYSASKAGLKAYGESLRPLLAPHGIAVNVVLPGYVASPMCDAMPGPKPFVWTPERAAKTIQAGLLANRARIAFPFWLSLGCQLLANLPDGLASWLLRRLGYTTEHRRPS